jgi:hypothetical protein
MLGTCGPVEAVELVVLFRWFQLLDMAQTFVGRFRSLVIVHGSLEVKVFVMARGVVALVFVVLGI